MSTSIEDKKFIHDVLSDTLLEESMEWIGTNMSPEDVFTYDILSEWAESHGFKGGGES